MGLEEQFFGLASGRTADEDGVIGVGPGVEGGFERGDGGFAPLARTVEEPAAERGIEDLALAGMEVEAKERFGERIELFGRIGFLDTRRLSRGGEGAGMRVE
jgi:hypothetical protein